MSFIDFMMVFQRDHQPTPLQNERCARKEDLVNLLPSRRSFVASMAVVGANAAIRPAFARAAERAQIQFGYAAITWGKAEREAVDDISSVGFSGIQFRADAFTEFKPDELRELLQQHKLTLVALSSGDLDIDLPAGSDPYGVHVAHAKFVQQVGGKYLQILDRLKPYPRVVTPAQCVTLGKMLTELGKRTADLGVKLGYHNHMNTISEHPDNLQRVLDVADPRYVHLELDVAHYLAGGGDPVKAIHTYHDNLLFLHLKDVVEIPLGTPGSQYPFKFVELGQGKVDLPAVFKALDEVRYKGWAVVELDHVPDESKTPKQCAEISKTYLRPWMPK